MRVLSQGLSMVWLSEFQRSECRALQIGELGQVLKGTSELPASNSGLAVVVEAQRPQRLGLDCELAGSQGWGVCGVCRSSSSGSSVSLEGERCEV